MTFEEVGLFRNEDALDAEWLPKNLPYREAQHHQIASCIKPLLQGRNGRNCIISGEPGIGKTAAVKLVLKELEEHPDVDTPDIQILYVNCWQKNTTYKIFVELCEQLGYKFVQNKNTEDLFRIIQNIVNKKCAVFAFDEVDKVVDVDFLYSIFTDVLKKAIIMVTNNPAWFATVDSRIKSRLLPQQIEFKKYTSQEIRGILTKRIEYAFVPNCWEKEALEKIIESTQKAEDVRIGLHLLREAGMVAEETKARKIGMEHAKIAMRRVGDFSIKPKDLLSPEAQVILGLVRNQSSKMGDLFKLYQEKGGEGTYKTFQRRIGELSQGGFVETKKVVGGKQGTTTIVSDKNMSLKDF